MTDCSGRCRARQHQSVRKVQTTLGMDVLSCRAPEMIKKEIWVYLIADKLIHTLMAQAGCLPAELSFKHSIQLWLTWGRHDAWKTVAIGWL